MSSRLFTCSVEEIYYVLRFYEDLWFLPQVISHKNYGSREEFDEALHHSLIAAGVEIVCLAGFMRILTGR